MKKGDIFIYITVLLLFIGTVFLIPRKIGTRVKVMQNNKVVYEGDLNTDKTVGIIGNTVVIKDGEVYMAEANCKRGICVHTGKIDKKGESIICLPNKVSVEIE